MTKKLTELPAATSVNASDVLYLAQASESKKVPLSVLDARTAATFQRKMVYDVRDYGAVGDGSTDDTTAIQSAINAAATSANAGIVFFPPGNYKISAGLTVQNSDITLQGSGIRATQIYANYHTAVPAISFKSGNGSYLYGNGLMGMKIYSTGVVATAASVAVRFDSCILWEAKQLYIWNFSVTALDLLTTWEGHIGFCEIQYCGFGGALTDGVINFGTSSVNAGQTGQSVVTNLIMGSCNGRHINIDNANGNGPIEFSNIVIENDGAATVSATNDNGPLIYIYNGQQINFSNMAITINPRSYVYATYAIYVEGPAASVHPQFVNTDISINTVANHVPVAGVICVNGQTNLVSLSDFTVWDQNNLIPDNMIISGTGKVSFANLNLRTAKTISALFADQSKLSGNYNYYNVGDNDYKTYWLLGSNSTQISGHLSVTGSFTFGWIAAGAQSDIPVTVTGTLRGDSCTATPVSATPEAGLVWCCYSVNGGVYIRMTNITAAPIYQDVINWRADVWKH